MKKSLLVLVGFTLSACAQAVPESGSGAGFQGYGDSSQYRTQRDAELAGQPPAATIPPATVAPATATPAAGAPGASASDPAHEASVATSAAPTTNSPNLSDEQNFDAVATRQSIESDAERLRQQAAAYQVIEPTALPSRGGASGPNIVQYAISTQNEVGQQIYRRSALGGLARFQRNCAKYASSDLAQEDFLRAGGPQKDRKGIDPDGDGYACFWDPTPFRQVNSSGG